MQGKIKNDEIYSLICPRHVSSPFSAARGLSHFLSPIFQAFIFALWQVSTLPFFAVCKYCSALEAIALQLSTPALNFPGKFQLIS